MRRCLRDPMFSRFDTIPECDRQTHTDTRRRHIPSLARRRAIKNVKIGSVSPEIAFLNKKKTRKLRKVKYMARSAGLPSGLNNSLGTDKVIVGLLSAARRQTLPWNFCIVLAIWLLKLTSTQRLRIIGLMPMKVTKVKIYK